MDSVSSRYASALFDIAKEENSLVLFEQELMIISDVFKDDDILSFFVNQTIHKEDKKALIEKYFKESVSKDIVHFLKLLIDKHRIKEVLGICQAFHEMYLEDQNIKEGILYCPYVLTNQQIHQVEDALSHKMNKTIHLKMVLDPSLIGGVRVEIDQEIFDGSIKNKINILKKDLLRK